MTTATQTRSVTVECEIAHPPEKLWRALTQPHLIAEWLMKNDFAPVVGHRFNLRGEWGGVLDCEVLDIETNRMLSYSWDFAHDDPAFNLKSEGRRALFLSLEYQSGLPRRQTGKTNHGSPTFSQRL